MALLPIITFISLSGCVPDDEPAALARHDEALRFPAGRIAVEAITLANGDPADLYAPRLPRPACGAFADDFPVIVFLQGGQTDKGAYAGFARELARFGFVVVVPDHRRVLGPPGSPPVPLTEGSVIGAALDAVRALDADPASAAYRVADTASVGVAGHSFGGVVALQLLNGTCTPPFCTPPAPVWPAEAHAVALFGTHMVVPSGVIDVSTAGVGVALLRGDLDGRALPASIEATYGVLDDNRALITVHGANHFAITDENPPAGATPDPVAQTIAQDEGVRLVARWTAYWFLDQLRGDHAAGVRLRVLGGAPNGAVTVDAIQ